MILLQVVLTVLLALGCLAWVWIVLVTVRSLHLMPRLREKDLPAVARWPRLTVIVPARDEADELAATCRSLLDLDYPDLEVLLVDDRSGDGTGALVDEVAAQDERVRGLHLGHLPGSWLGKNRALHVAATQATGEWVLFTQAGVRFSKGALRQSIRWAIAGARDHVTLVPDGGERGLLAEATAGAAARALFVGLRPWAVGEQDSDAFFGLGAFQLVKRSLLERANGLEDVRLDVADDLALARRLRSVGARSGVAVGSGLVSAPSATGVTTLAAVLERRVYPTMGCSLARTAASGLALGLLELAPWICLIPFGIPMLHGLGLAATACLLATSMGMAAHLGRPLHTGLLAPLGGVALVSLWLRAGLVGAASGGVHCRDVFYPADLLRRGSTVTFPWWSGRVPEVLRAWLALPRGDRVEPKVLA